MIRFVFSSFKLLTEIKKSEKFEYLEIINSLNKEYTTLSYMFLVV